MLNWIATCKQKPNDIKMTPPELAKNCINITPFKEGDTLMDGFRGSGSFYNNYPANVNKLWCEIEEGKDFFKCEDSYDWFLTNPAFSLITPTLQHACKYARKGIGILIGSMNMTPKRLEILQDNGFSITHLHYATVTGWLGVTIFIVAERNKNNIITYDRAPHKMPGKEGEDFKAKLKTYNKNYIRKSLHK